ncbi:ATP-binding protein [Chloroflexales bacterium ZM16-3]|nr:ATP-binding protein [Chloroflexales bacterium ZM16-3]
MSIPPAAFSGALRPQRLIGREPQLQQIRAQIIDPGLGDAFRCVLITADGGKGKTRLLQEIDRTIAASGEPVIVLPLIDLADPTLHSVAAFLQRVSGALKDALGTAGHEMLRPFDTASEQYEQAHDSQKMISLKQANDSLISAFKRAYMQIVAGRRVVWMLDTMEQLFATPPEIADLIRFDSAIHLTEIGPTTYHWLLSFITDRTPNTTMLLAGRPVPGRWVAGISNALLQSDVTSIPADDDEEEAAPLAQVLPLSVDDFTVDQVDDYLAALQQELAQFPTLADQADFVSGLQQSADDREALYLLTEGNPIRLALYVDLLMSNGVFPEPFRMPLAALKQELATNRKQMLSSVDDSLLDYIASQLGDNLSQVLDYLSIMRRGLDSERLERIWGGTREESDAALGQLRALSFIKHRPDGRYFLHDELYQIYQLEFERRDEPTCAARRDHERAIYAQLIALCNQELRAQNQAILAFHLRPDDQSDQVQAELRARRIRRRQLQAERLHYSLYLDPARAFYEVYFELTEQAFTTYDFELDSLLQSEISGFFFGGTAHLNCLQTGMQTDDWEQLRFAVLHERVSGWIKRLTKSSLALQARELVEAALRDHAALVRQHYAGQPFADMLALYDQPVGRLLSAVFAEEWRACGQFAAIYSGSAQAAISEIGRLSASFETLMRGQPLVDLPEAGLSLLAPEFRNRLLNIIAQCTMFVGYAHATLNRFTLARDHYRQAEYLLVHARPPLETLLAEVKNNLSRALGELSEVDDALMICDEGATINRHLGLDYNLAIAYNTKALIATLNQRPDIGLRSAQLALRLFRHRLDLRGIGLALIQAGEGARRSWWAEADLQAQDELDPTLRSVAPTEQALRDLHNAVTIFAGLKEPLRQMESHSALACLYRDRANYLHQDVEGADFKQALEHFGQARAVAVGDDPKAKKFPSQELAILADWAWLYKRAGAYAEASRITAEALLIAPPELQLSSERPLDIELARKNIGTLRELSKLAALGADITAAQAADQERGKAEFQQLLLASIEQRMLAMAYLQIVTPANNYLAQNRRKLYTLLSQQHLQSPEIRAQIQAHAIHVVRSYHLDAVQEKIGPLASLEMIADLFRLPTYLDYV